MSSMYLAYTIFAMKNSSVEFTCEAFQNGHSLESVCVCVHVPVSVPFERTIYAYTKFGKGWFFFRCVRSLNMCTHFVENSSAAMNRSHVTIDESPYIKPIEAAVINIRLDSSTAFKKSITRERPAEKQKGKKARMAKYVQTHKCDKCESHPCTIGKCTYSTLK